MQYRHQRLGSCYREHELLHYAVFGACLLSQTIPTTLLCNRWHGVHCLFIILASVERRSLYSQLRDAYHSVRVDGSPRFPPLEEWQGITEICEHIFCRFVSVICTWYNSFRSVAAFCEPLTHPCIFPDHMRQATFTKCSCCRNTCLMPVPVT